MQAKQHRCEECTFSSDNVDGITLHRQNEHVLIKCGEYEYSAKIDDELRKHTKDKHVRTDDEIANLLLELSHAKKELETMENDKKALQIGVEQADGGLTKEKENLASVNNELETVENDRNSVRKEL